jgi:alpha-tubulin suppressor-like RCC1 family protein
MLRSRMTLPRPRRRLPRLLLPTLALLTACWQSTPVTTPPPTTAPPKPTATPTTTAPADPILELASQSFHTCARRKSGTVLCWGKNTHGQLGNGTTGVDTDHPVLVAGGMTWSSISAARDHTCALTVAGAAYCWGRKGFGLLGNGSNQPAVTDVPLPVSGGRTYTTLETGVQPTCGLSTDDRTYCWHSLTGLPESTVFEPTLIPGDPSLVFQQIDPGTLLHRCGVTTADDGYCWGRNVDGVLGVADTLSRSEPTLVAGGHEWRSISAGGLSSCGLRTDGVVLCWGRDNQGATGQGGANSPTKLLVPTAIVGGLAFTQITEGAETFCGLIANGEAYCWGSGGRGALGNGTFATSSAAPVKVVLPGGP